MGSREPRIQSPIFDQWTGTPIVRELEVRFKSQRSFTQVWFWFLRAWLQDGDTLEEVGIKNGAVITVLSHSDDYAVSFLSWNPKGAIMSLVR